MDRDPRRPRRGRDPPPDPLDVLFDLLIEEGGSVPTIYAHHTEKDMNLALLQPWCSVGSDGSALAVEGPLRRGHPHPRNFGTFPRILGVYVRETRPAAAGGRRPQDDLAERRQARPPRPRPAAARQRSPT